MPLDKFRKSGILLVMDDIFCEECGKKIIGKPVWLELDQRTYTYTKRDVPIEFSQGGFTFGKTCAKKLLKIDQEEWKKYVDDTE